MMLHCLLQHVFVMSLVLICQCDFCKLTWLRFMYMSDISCVASVTNKPVFILWLMKKLKHVS